MPKLGNGLSAQRDNNHAIIYKGGQLLKRVDLQDGVERRLLIVDLVKRMGAAPSKVAEGLDISRQSVYNALGSFERFGHTGLLHSGKNGVGNKARLHESRRRWDKESREQAEDNGENQKELALTDEVAENFSQTHGWLKSRYAGGLIFTANKEEIEALAEDLFSDVMIVNNHRYRFYEFPEKKTYNNAEKTLSVTLRRIVIWNLSSNRRPVCVTNDTLEDTLFIGQAMLGRWGKSENGFKYLGDRFNPHYIPLLRANGRSS